MNTQQIHKLLYADIFVRRCLFQVLARDQLPTKFNPHQPAAFIINTDASDLPGSHWVALFYNGVGRFEYFDSFGFPPFYTEITDFIAENSARPVYYNTKPLQHVLSNMCGLYAVYFILLKCRGASMKRILLPFSMSQHINDRIVWRLIKPWLLKTRLGLL